MVDRIMMMVGEAEAERKGRGDEEGFKGRRALVWLGVNKYTFVADRVFKGIGEGGEWVGR